MSELSGKASEAEEWAVAVRGDADAFARIFDRNKDRVYRYALRLLGSVHDAEDLTALVFFEAWRLRARVRVVDGSVIAWLLVTASNISRNQLRARRRHQMAMSKLPSSSEPDHSDKVLEAADAERDGRRVHVAFALLSEREQEVLTLCVLEEFSLKQAAVALRLPVGTVKSRLSRSKVHLAQLMAPPTATHETMQGGASL